MALSLEDAVKVRQRVLAEIRKPKTQAQLKALFSYLAQHKGSPQLQFVSFAALSASTVLADAPCKVYAIFTKKPSASTTTSYFMLTNSASAASNTAADVEFPMIAANEDLVQFFDGLAMSAGVSVLGAVAADGGAGSSAADRADGFVIVGAP